MDPTALYYALSTIAQCAAALAALIGFLGLWRLDRFPEEESKAEEALKAALIFAGVHIDALSFNKQALLQAAARIIETPIGQAEQQGKTKLEEVHARLTALPDERQRLMRALKRFLSVTLAILVLAIVGIPFVGTLHTWPWTLTILIMLASLGLGIGLAYVVREAARSTRALPTLALLLILLIGTAATASEQSDWANLVGLTTVSEVISVSLHLEGAEDFNLSVERLRTLVRERLEKEGLLGGPDKQQQASLNISIIGQSSGGGGADYSVEMALSARVQSPFVKDRTIRAVIWQSMKADHQLMSYEPTTKQIFNPPGPLHMRVETTLLQVLETFILDLRKAKPTKDK